jgi:LytS/YehU family sensor histidine kinase
MRSAVSWRESGLSAARIVGAWLAIQTYFSGGKLIVGTYGPWIEVAVPAAVAALVWAAMTAPLIAVLERLAFERHRVRDVMVVILATLLLAASCSALELAIVPHRRRPFGTALRHRTVAPNLTVAVLAVVFGLAMAGRYEATRHERLRRHLDAVLTRKRADQVRARLTPPFLSETLERIGDLIHRDAAKADRLLANLARLLETLMRFDRAEAVTLEEELEFLDCYVAVHPRLDALRIRADEPSLSAALPPLALLPAIDLLAEAGASTVFVDASARADLRVRVRGETGLSVADAILGLDVLKTRLRHFHEEAVAVSRNDEQLSVVVRIRRPLTSEGGR